MDLQYNFIDKGAMAWQINKLIYFWVIPPMLNIVTGSMDILRIKKKVHDKLDIIDNIMGSRLHLARYCTTHQFLIWPGSLMNSSKRD